MNSTSALTPVSILTYGAVAGEMAQCLSGCGADLGIGVVDRLDQGRAGFLGLEAQTA